VDAPGRRHRRRLLGDRMGAKTPLDDLHPVVSICNFIAGFLATFTFLLIFRTL